MKKNIYIFVLLAFIFTTININAQIKIGDTTPPASFSILELEALLQKGGLRLPRLTGQKSQALKTYLNSLSATDKQAANGLVIYNTELPGMQYWDGTDWVEVKHQHGLIGKNGVTAINEVSGGLELGGTLTKPSTTIGLNGYTLNMPVKDNNDQFVVSNTDTGENPLNIKNGKVGIGGSTDPQKTLDIYNTDPDIPAIKITNSNEKSSYLLSSDFFGNALWQPLKPLASVVYGELKDKYTYGGTYYPNDYNITEEPLRLSRGKWLIVGKFTAKSGIGTDQNQYYSYLKLRKSTKKDPVEIATSANYDANYTKLTTTATLPTKTAYIGPDGGDDSGNSQIYVTPQVLYYAEVEGNDEFFHILVSSSRQFETTKAYGDYFFALRIDGMGMAIAVNGTTECTAFAGITRILETGQTLPAGITGTVSIRLTSGSLYLEENDHIGSVNGINIVVTGGPYSLTTSASATPVNVKLEGTLETRVSSGSFRVPVNIANATFSPNCAGPTITVPTRGTLDCSVLSNYNIYTGRGRTLNITGATAGLDLTSGSVSLAAGQTLASTNGLILTYDNINASTIYAINNVNLPVKISGTVSNTASGQFTIRPAITNITGCSSGATINVVIAQLDCGSAKLNPSNKPVYSVVPIDIVVNPVSASYPLKSGQVLGNQSGIKVTYIGNDITLTPGTHTINVLVSSGNVTKAVGNYTVNLNTLYNYGIDACIMNVNVMHYGKFEDVAPIEMPIRSGNVDASISVPLTVTTNSVTINPGELLGSVTANGKTYQAIADISTAITVNSGNTTNIPVKVTGPEDNVVRSYTINLNKAIGVESNTVRIDFITYGSFGSVNPINLPVSSGNVNTTVSIPLNVTASKKVTINNGDVLGSVTNNGKTYQVIVDTSSPIVVNGPNSVNVPAKITGPEETNSGRSYTIPLNRTPAIGTSNIIINFN